MNKPEIVSTTHNSEQAKLEHAFDKIVTKSYLGDMHNAPVNDYVPSSEWIKVKWIKITKLVFEKEIFFADKLAMLYTALHPVASQVILLLKKSGSQFELYLGTRDLNNEGLGISDYTLRKGLKGYLPGVHYEEAEMSGDAFLPGVLEPVKENETISADMKKQKQLLDGIMHVSCVSGVAAFKDDKKENFIQGLERLINATTSSDDYIALFIADKICSEEIRSIRNAYEVLYSKLSPFVQNQITFSETESHGVSTSISESLSVSISESVSETITRGKNWSEGHSSSDSISYNVMPIGIGVSKTLGTTDQNHEGVHEDKAIADSKGRTDMRQIAKQIGEQLEKSKGLSNQITLENMRVRNYMDIIDKQRKRLVNSEAFGMWSCATYFMADGESRVKSLAGIYKGCIIGEDSDIEISAVNFWKDKSEIVKYLQQAEHPLFSINNYKVTAGSIVNSKELAIHFSLPQSSVPGILVREQTAFGRNVIYNEGMSSPLPIGCIQHLGETDERNIVNIDLEGLKKHTFITGTTGSGKSNTLYLILQHLLDENHSGTGEKNKDEEIRKDKKKDKHFLVIEPAKGEYKKVFGLNSDVTVLGCIPSQGSMLRINPFMFPEGIHVYEHIDCLVEIFNACWPMYAAMPVVLKHAIEEAYKSCGWDMDNSKNPFKLYPTMKDVTISLNKFLEESKYSNDTKNDYKGALETRLVSLSEGLNGHIFCSSQVIDDQQLFDNNVIIDLSRMSSTENKALIMGLLVMKLKEYRMTTTAKMNDSLQHVTVLEEAHHLLKRVNTDQVHESANLIGKSVEMITNGIAEMRTYGEGFIIADQSPSMLDLAAIRNTNTKIVLSLPEAEDREVAGKSIGLTEEQISEISKLKRGEAIVYQNEWEEAVLCKIDEFIPQNIKDEKDNSKDNRNNGASNDFSRTDDKEAYKSVIKFLYQYCSDRTSEIDDVDKLKGAIKDSLLASSLKYALFEMVDNYEKRGKVCDLTPENHVKIMQLTAACIGRCEEISKIVATHKEVNAINDSITELLKEIIPDGDGKFYKFCVRSILRSEVEDNPRMIEVYNDFLKRNY